MKLAIFQLPKMRCITQMVILVTFANFSVPKCDLPGISQVRKVLGAGGDVNIEQILDPAVRASHPNLEGVWIVAEVALRSVEPKAVHRPTMADVIQELRAAIALEHAPASAHNSRAAPPARHTFSRSSAESDLTSHVFYESESMPAPR